MVHVVLCVFEAAYQSLQKFHCYYVLMSRLKGVFVEGVVQALNWVRVVLRLVQEQHIVVQGEHVETLEEEEGQLVHMEFSILLYVHLE